MAADGIGEPVLLATDDIVPPSDGGDIVLMFPRECDSEFCVYTLTATIFDSAGHASEPLSVDVLVQEGEGPFE